MRTPIGRTLGRDGEDVSGDRSDRALTTTLRPAAIGLLLSSAAGIALLHVVRADLNPVHHRLSEYANGAYGSVMTASFFALGAGMVVLGLAMRQTASSGRWSHVVRLALVVAGFGMVLSGVYPTDPGGAPTTNERVHSLASGAASVALIGAVALAALVPWSRVPRRATGAGGLLAFIVLILGVASPILHDTDWTGLSQRLLWAALMAWLLVNAWKLAR
jgi:hypothetical protein